MIIIMIIIIILMTLCLENTIYQIDFYFVLNLGPRNGPGYYVIWHQAEGNIVIIIEIMIMTIIIIIIMMIIIIIIIVRIIRGDLKLLHEPFYTLAIYTPLIRINAD